MAINGARQSIDLEAPYFVPDELTLGALRDALARGVTIRLLVPGPHVDSQVVSGASQARWGAMLQAGAQWQRRPWRQRVLDWLALQTVSQL